ncbi:FAD-binding protein [Bengtsoniella intestinalis]|uniref:FAD-binding protein n=1 Tax=Bengtsoniella intestinalis TaxID=3073143 RepID=UPI00391F1520
MTQSTFMGVTLYTCNTAVVGSGAAGFNAADSLFVKGQEDVVLVTELLNAGTSRNTGSDKQTYYKLTLSGGDGDSVLEMAKTLFEGQCMDGDNALCEASQSTKSFLKLSELGVPFPKNRYGEYIGYKTDHDPRRRATSVGPYTSKKMTECLEKAVKSKNIPILDHMQVISILTDKEQVCGLLCLNTAQDAPSKYAIVRCTNVIYATGGPASIYANSVYPASHFGATGVAFAAGVKGQNLTEWQYGMGSLVPRWNVSGTYMQVLPRFISTNQDLSDEKEFLYDFFTDESDMLSKVFLKGYQWPFDVRKIQDGSSIIDILVYCESRKNRRVFLDFRENPKGKEVDFKSLSEESFTYLDKAGACFGKPIDRLLHMNAPAVDFYMDRGVNLREQPLEIALCAQHNNGGLAVDAWWQTNVKGFFAVGEVAGTHGVYRPGGSALNSGQVGSSRAAEYVAANCQEGGVAEDVFNACAKEALTKAQALEASAMDDTKNTYDDYIKEVTGLMSQFGGSMRNAQEIEKLMGHIQQLLVTFSEVVFATNPKKLGKVFRLRDILVCQYVYLSAMLDYIAQSGKSRGSALYTNPEGVKPYEQLPDMFTFILDDNSLSDQIQEIAYDQGACQCHWRTVRPIPMEDDFFENVWRQYRENGNVY